MANADVEAQLQEKQREYEDFLDDGNDQGIYADKIRSLIDTKKYRLIVNINDLRRKNPNRAKGFFTHCTEELVAFQRALLSVIRSLGHKVEEEEYFIGLEGSFGDRHVSPRTLTSRLLGGIVIVEGIVTKTSLVKPKITRSVHYCPTTKKFTERRYHDSLSGIFEAPTVYPRKDDEGNLLETEFGLSKYRDHQTLTIQEMPEKAPPGQLPRFVDIICDNDLADLCKPGDRLQVIGTYRSLPFKNGGIASTMFRTAVVANNMRLLSKEERVSMSSQDVKKCRTFSRQKNADPFNILAQSLAPSIHGHEYVKRALLCQLLGGVEKVLPNGTRIRGDINILLIGDPSVAKSQLLRYIQQTALRAVSTTGRSASGPGLTAAVVSNPETGERRFEAGVMVMGDRGIVCIDEFDKMTDADRTALHEVMEQGRVTITKAGIQARLNARCALLAAANPVWGRYDQYKTPMENIGLQDSLLSRFDLLFILLDKMDAESDLSVADHVVRMHCFRNPDEEDGQPLPLFVTDIPLTTRDLDSEMETEHETQVYEKYDAKLHGPNRKEQKIVTKEFMRKYLHIARSIKPSLTQEACDLIAAEYARLRQTSSGMEDGLARTQPITVRTLETLIRLATAHAKARFSIEVTTEDAQRAIELVQFAIFKKVLETTQKKRRRQTTGFSTGSSSEGEDEMETQDEYTFREEGQTGRPERPKRRRKADLEPEQAGDSEPVPEGPRSGEVPSVSFERLTEFRNLVSKFFHQERAQSLTISRIMDHLADLNLATPFTQEEIDVILEKMQDDNQILISDGIVFLI